MGYRPHRQRDSDIFNFYWTDGRCHYPGESAAHLRCDSLWDTYSSVCDADLGRTLGQEGRRVSYGTRCRLTILEEKNPAAACRAEASWAGCSASCGRFVLIFGACRVLAGRVAKTSSTPKPLCLQSFKRSRTIFFFRRSGLWHASCLGCHNDVGVFRRPVWVGRGLLEMPSFHRTESHEHNGQCQQRQ